jgi:uncharacterized protein (DUF305 family)
MFSLNFKTSRQPASLLLLSALACSRAVNQPNTVAGGDLHAGHEGHAAMVADQAGGHSHSGLPDDLVIPAGETYTVADVHFMQGMIAHHAQAIEMSKLAEQHSRDARLIRFAQKIDQSQATEIQQMEGWLADRKQWIPDSAAYHGITMTGMLTPDDMKKLSEARGTAFDQLFLELMIQHHEGALAMVKDLFATPGGGQEINVNVFANEVDMVQTIEIGLMRQMLEELNGAQ